MGRGVSAQLHHVNLEGDFLLVRSLMIHEGHMILIHDQGTFSNLFLARGSMLDSIFLFLQKGQHVVFFSFTTHHPPPSPPPKKKQQLGHPKFLKNRLDLTRLAGRVWSRFIKRRVNWSRGCPAGRAWEIG